MGPTDIVIISAARTPFDRFGGTLRDVPPNQLGSAVVRELINRAGIADNEVDEVNLGLCIQVEAALETNSIARQIVLDSLSSEVLSITLDRACCSTTTAVQYTARNLRLGITQMGIACGVENMSRASYMTSPGLRWEGKRMGDLVLKDPMFRLGYPGFSPLAVDAGEVAVEYGVPREEQDDWAYRSQQHYQKAFAAGNFDQEIFPVSFQVGKKTVSLDADSQPRPNVTREQLANLSTVYGSPTVTAGNAPGMNTGATGLHRTDVQYVVTEYGVANLKGQNLRTRVEELISIAHPDFRDWLKSEAQRMYFIP
ncbi:MAG: acetyl-CoA hydrolase/transferase C-terminal domain-containing protein [Bacillota bacterium]|nr:acetyl-CoA hydrolase/transferase C-terminal domain-containing protein [Bacillota bacterium]